MRASPAAAGARLDLKIVVLGSPGVGKSCLVQRFTEDDFSADSPPTVRASFRYKQCAVGSTTVTCGLWDVGGHTRWDTLQSFYCRNARGILLCYDPTRRKSFTDLPRWLAKARAEAEKDCIFIVVATRTDLIGSRDRKVTRKEAQQFAKTCGADVRHVETSAKANKGVTDAFDVIIARFAEQQLARIRQKKQQRRERRSKGGKANGYGSMNMSDDPASPLFAAGDAEDGGGCCRKCVIL